MFEEELNAQKCTHPVDIQLKIWEINNKPLNRWPISECLLVIQRCSLVEFNDSFIFLYRLLKIITGFGEKI